MPAAPAIGSPVRTVEFLGGTPETLVSDGASTEVIRERRDGPKPDRTCLDFARGCEIAVVLAKARLRDKVKAEACVQRVESRILESLRNFAELDCPHGRGADRGLRCRRRSERTARRNTRLWRPRKPAVGPGSRDAPLWPARLLLCRPPGPRSLAMLAPDLVGCRQDTQALDPRLPNLVDEGPDRGPDLSWRRLEPGPAQERRGRGNRRLLADGGCRV